MDALSLVFILIRLNNNRGICPELISIVYSGMRLVLYAKNEKIVKLFT